MIRKYLGAATAVAIMLTGQAFAYDRLPDGTTTEERANTARLNAEQAARAQAEIADYQQRLAAAAQQEAAAAATYRQNTAAYEAEKARIAEMSVNERLLWEADVAACKAGEVARCAKPSPQP